MYSFGNRMHYSRNGYFITLNHINPIIGVPIPGVGNSRSRSLTTCHDSQDSQRVSACRLAIVGKEFFSGGGMSRPSHLMSLFDYKGQPRSFHTLKPSKRKSSEGFLYGSVTVWPGTSSEFCFPEVWVKRHLLSRAQIRVREAYLKPRRRVWRWFSTFSVRETPLGYPLILMRTCRSVGVELFWDLL